MKSTAKHIAPKLFTPVALTITIESQRELDILGALFNSGIIASAHAKMGFDQKIWSSLESVGANLDASDFNAILKKQL
jgi:hypothetical protein